MDPNTVCTACPACGHHRFRKIRAKGFSIVSPRKCTLCAQEYRPPTPKALAVVGIIAGLVLALPSVASILLLGVVIIVNPDRPVNPLNFVCPAICAGLGILAIVGSAKAMGEHPVEPPEYREEKPKLDRS